MFKQSLIVLLVILGLLHLIIFPWGTLLTILAGGGILCFGIAAVLASGGRK